MWKGNIGSIPSHNVLCSPYAIIISHIQELYSLTHLNFYFIIWYKTLLTLTGFEQAVTHPSTDLSRCCLTSVIKPGTLAAIFNLWIFIFVVVDLWLVQIHCTCICNHQINIYLCSIIRTADGLVVACLPQKSGFRVQIHPTANCFWQFNID